jgi:tRNA-Thr(GGU) m(6)t(6)A37 methyltransferase TsaA
MRQSKYKIEIEPVGWIESPLKTRAEAPRQGQEAKIKGKIVIYSKFKRAIKGLKVGDYIWVLCWFHLASRDTLEVYPRLAQERGPAGVFCSRSPDRPNPIGLELVRILKIEENKLLVEGLDALDKTPVLDIKLHFTSIDCP